MGQAKRRKAALGDVYGTPAGSNGKLVAYKDSDQSKLDQEALQRIQSALDKGMPVTLIGTDAARPLAQAAGLQWLHEIPVGGAVPRSVAWNPSRNVVLRSTMRPANGLVVIGAGTIEYLKNVVQPHEMHSMMCKGWPLHKYKNATA